MAGCFKQLRHISSWHFDMWQGQYRPRAVLGIERVNDKVKSMGEHLNKAPCTRIVCIYLCSYPWSVGAEQLKETELHVPAPIHDDFGSYVLTSQGYRHRTNTTT